MQDYIRKNKVSTTDYTIIIPTEIFYLKSYIENADTETSGFSLDHNMKYEQDAFIILQNSINHQNINWNRRHTYVFIGLLINYIKNKIFVIQWETTSNPDTDKYKFREIKKTIRKLTDDHHIFSSNATTFKTDRILFKEYIEMLIECLNKSISFLTEHIPNNDMNKYIPNNKNKYIPNNDTIQTQIEELTNLKNKLWTKE